MPVVVHCNGSKNGFLRTIQLLFIQNINEMIGTRVWLHLQVARLAECFICLASKMIFCKWVKKQKNNSKKHERCKIGRLDDSWWQESEMKWNLKCVQHAREWQTHKRVSWCESHSSRGKQMCTANKWVTQQIRKTTLTSKWLLMRDVWWEVTF